MNPDDEPDDFARQSCKRTVSAATAPRPDVKPWANTPWPFGPAQLPADELISATPTTPEPAMPTKTTEPPLTSADGVSNRFKVCSLLVANGPMSLADLAKAIDVNSTALSKLAYAWKSKGLIERSSDGTWGIAAAGRAYVNGDTASADTGLGAMFKTRAAAKKQASKKSKSKPRQLPAAQTAPDPEPLASEDDQFFGITNWSDGTLSLTVGDTSLTMSKRDLVNLHTLLLTTTALFE